MPTFKTLQVCKVLPFFNRLCANLVTSPFSFQGVTGKEFSIGRDGVGSRFEFTALASESGGMQPFAVLSSDSPIVVNIFKLIVSRFK